MKSHCKGEKLRLTLDMDRLENDLFKFKSILNSFFDSFTYVYISVRLTPNLTIPFPWCSLSQHVLSHPLKNNPKFNYCCLHEHG